jgi:cell division protein FtsB
MDTIRKDDRNDARVEKKWEDRAPATTTRWLVILGLLFLTAAIFGGQYAYQQSSATTDLTVQNQALHTTIDQMRNQIDTLATKLDQNSGGLRVEPAPLNAPPPAASAPATKRATSTNSAAQDRRMKQVQSQLAVQQKQLKDTQNQLTAAKSDLEGQLGSTRDELNGSIARTHEELVGLEKRGERKYYEFDLSKSKDFQREGPIQISLRKADSKHQSYDLMMLVDDHQLSKKKVDLYEPIWLHQSEQPQPVQVVVNKIDKNTIHGYVSAARYKDSDLASNATQPAADMTSTTISTPTSTPSSSSSSTAPSATATSSQGQEQPLE